MILGMISSRTYVAIGRLRELRDCLRFPIFETFCQEKIVSQIAVPAAGCPQ
jgi:hypothetical protein